MEFDYLKLEDEIDFESNLFKYLDSGITLTNFEIQVLEKYNINYKKCNSLKEVLFFIEQVLEEDDYKDLEEVSLKIAERDYYKNTNK